MLMEMGKLHTDLTLDAINYQTTASKLTTKKEVNKSAAVVDCPYL